MIRFYHFRNLDIIEPFRDKIRFAFKYEYFSVKQICRAA